MKTWIRAITIPLLLLCTAATVQAEHRLGAGVHYWTTVNDIEPSDFENLDDKDLVEEGFSGLITYQYVPKGLLKFEADLEIFPQGFAGADHDVYAPQVFVLVGGTIYGGVGIGGYYNDGSFADQPFYALRAGLDIQLLPFLYLDINANYRFDQWETISEMQRNVNTDTVTLGGGVRLAF